ncbi:MAG TPA: enoyl-CoA hydratase-related protein [Candidatus Dormibacteraeota bacterium]
MSEVVRVERSGAHAVLVIDHPKANAISAAVLEQLNGALDQLEGDPSVRAVVLTGAGPRFFAAGADITEFPERGRGGRAAVGGMPLATRLAEYPKPTLAAVNGIALGGGCELAMGCDVRIAARSARFGQPEINLGIIPGWGGTQRLPRLIGQGRAALLLLLGEAIDAETALRWGLVSEVVDDAELPAAAAALAERLAAQPPLAVAATKRCLNEGLDRPLAEGLSVEQREFAAIFGTEDAREGVSAYLEKRSPSWRGR